MKTKNIIILLLLFLSVCLHAQSWMWGRKGTSSSIINGCPHAFLSFSTSGANNNAYIAGQYSSILNLGVDTLRNGSVFFVKYNSLGALKWNISSLDSLNSYGFGSCISPDKNGNIYLTGGYAGTIKIGSFTLRTTNGNIIAPFLIKLDSNGNILWIRRGIVPSNPLAGGKGICLTVDNLGNPIIVGAFNDTIAFGTDTLINGPFFIVKYDPNGNIIWAKQSINPSNNFQANLGTITADNSGNILITGDFLDTVTFGSYTLKNNIKFPSAFLVKYSSSGNVLWAKQTTINVWDSSKNSAGGAAVITDMAKNIFVAGEFDDTVQFSSHTLCTTTSYNIFLAKYDSNGNIVWVKKSSTNGWEANSLAADAHNRIYLGGYYLTTYPDTITFGSYSIHALNENVNNASFIMAFDTSGSPICGSVLNYLGPCSITSDSTGNYTYIAGTFNNSTIICGPDTLTESGSNDGIFVGRWLSCDYREEGMNEPSKNNTASILYPNPNTGNFQIAISQQLSANSQIEVYNILGEQVYQAPLNATTTQISMSNKAEGLYLYRVITKTGTLVGEGKFVIQR